MGQTIESLVIDRDSQKTGLQQFQSEFGALEQVRDEQALLIEKFRTELATMYKSKSWRLTSPLRWLVRQLYHPNRTLSREIHASLPARSSQYQQTSQKATEKSTLTTKDNGSNFRILLVSHYSPSRAHAGGLRILDIYTLIRERCPNVQIDIFTFHRPSIDWSLEDVHRTFHNVYLSPVEELKPDALLALRGSPLQYDVIDLQFHQSGNQIDSFRRIGSKILFTPMESLAKVALTNLRAKQLTSGSHLFKTAASLRSAAEEIIFALKADEVVCVSRSDAALLRTLTASRRVRGLDTGVSQLEFAEALALDFSGTSAEKRRCNILYLAYFGSETNVLALRWYLDHVHPIIQERVPAYVLTVVGRGDLSAFSSYQDTSIEFVGEVDAIAPFIRVSRVGIAPALAGSGLRGKVNQYAILGVPSVVSPIAHKGLAYQDGVNIFIAEEPEVFADRCIQLLTDLELNDRMGLAARKLCMGSYSWQSKWPIISKIYNLAGLETKNES